MVSTHAHADSQIPPPRWRWRLTVPTALVLLIVLTFIPALDCGLVNWGDDDLLLDVSRHGIRSPASPAWMFSTANGGYFQPLPWLTYALDWGMWKLEIFGYHLTGVVLHLLTALFFYFTVRRLTWLAWLPRESLVSARTCLAAGLAAALFALHPLRAEPVAWLMERGTLMGGLFFVLSVCCYLRYAATGCVQPDGDRVRRPRFGFSSARGMYSAAVVLCALSLLARPDAVVMPLVLLVLDRYPLRRFRPASDTPRRGVVERKPQSPVLWEKLPFFALSAVFALPVIAAKVGNTDFDFSLPSGLLTPIAGGIHALVFPLWKSVWPMNLGPLYEPFGPDGWRDVGLWASAGGVALAAVTAFRLRRRVPALAAAFLSYAALLMTTVAFAPPGSPLAADRYSYLACMSLAALVGGATLQAQRQIRRRSPGLSPAMPALFVAVALTLLVRSTYAQCDVWRSALTLWAHGVRISPHSATAHTFFGNALAGAEDFHGAAVRYRRALGLRAGHSVAHHHLADLLGRLGHGEAAIGHYRKALVIEPGRSAASLSLAKALAYDGQVPQALEVLRDGVRRNGDALELMEYLAWLLAVHPDGAIRDGREAVVLALRVNDAREFRHVPSLLILATAYADAGRFEEAVHTAQYALSLTDARTVEGLRRELQHRLELFRAGRPYHLDADAE